MSSSIRIIDPVYFNANKSAEFRLNEETTAYLTSGMYLCLGSYGTNAEVNVVKYNRRAGVASVVRAIRLLNGGDVIAQLEQAGPWMAWKGTNHDNADARSKKQASFAEGSLIHDSIMVFNQQQVISNSGDAVPVGSLGETEEESCLGYVAIKEFLKELEVLRALPTTVFDNLRLVVDFTSDILTICGKLDNTTSDLVSSLKASRPLLVCDVVKDPELIEMMTRDMSQVSFTGIESDQFVLPAVTVAGGRKTHVQTLRGFNNKVINRVLLVNSPTEAQLGVQQNHGNGDGTFINNALSSGRLNSLCQNRYTVNCRVNGASIFAGRGLGYDETFGATTGAGYNHRLAILTDTWGDVSVCQGGNTCGLVAQGLTAFGDAVEITANGEILAKNPGHIFFGQDYTGFKVMSRVSHLEMTVARSPIAVADKPRMNAGATNQAINQIVYAEVPKVLMIDGGSYRIAYL